MRTTKEKAHKNFHDLTVTEVGPGRWQIECNLRRGRLSTITKNVAAVYNWQSDPEEMEKQSYAPPRNRKLAGYIALINEIEKANFKR